MSSKHQSLKKDFLDVKIADLRKKNRNTKNDLNRIFHDAFQIIEFQCISILETNPKPNR